MIKRFLNLPRYQKRLVSVASDIFALFVSIWLAYSLRLEAYPWMPSQEQMLAAAATVVLTIGIFIRTGLYRAVIRFLGDKAFLTIIYGVIVSSLSLIVFGYLFQAFVPRSVPIIYGALAFLFVSGTRLSVRMLVNRPLQLLKEPVAIVGAGETGMQLASALEKGAKFRPAVFVSFDPSNHKTLINGLPVIGLEYLEKHLPKYNVQRVLLALDADSTVDRKGLLEKLEPLAVPVQTVPSVSELVAGEARINDIRDLEIEDLLGRDPVLPDDDLADKSLFQKSVMVTGAGGSIGSELCRQIIRYRPSTLVLYERSEFSLYDIERQLKTMNQAEDLGVNIYALLGSVTNRHRCKSIMDIHGVQTVYHAAAYKHVPIVEQNVIEGVQNNVFGTLHAAEAAISSGVERFVLISTDKAVRPTNVMGATKRVAELVLQGLARRQDETILSMVRFGNVLGSSGSVVPLFRDQINNGGPVTVTHPEIIRYFMTIPEASQLVLQAGNMGEGGEVFVLDMGEPVRIADLARKMIHLMGFDERTDEHPDGQIEIRFTGLRPGEKLYEELLVGGNPEKTAHPRIMMAREACLEWPDIEASLNRLAEACVSSNSTAIFQEFNTLPIEFSHQTGASERVAVTQRQSDVVAR